MTGNGKKINLLFVLLQMATGGAEKVALTIAEHLDRSLFRVHVAGFEGGALRDRFSEVSEAVFQVPRRNGRDLKTVLLLSRIIRENHIDVINCHHYAAFFYSWLAARLARAGTIVYTEHSAGEVEDIRHIHKFLCSSLFFKKTGAIVGVSREIGDAFSTRFPGHGRLVTSIPNGIDVQKFAGTGRREQVRNAFGIAPDDFLIGTIANFRRVKNHLCLLRAFTLLGAARPGTRLVFVGRGYADDGENSEKEVRDYVQTYGLEDRVLFAGYREDIADILESLDLFCLPSVSEGLPVSVLEAMAAGVPVVGSDVRGIREVVRHGRTGLLFPSNDATSLARAIESLIGDVRTRTRLTEEAFSYVRLEHDLRPWIARYENLFQGSFHA
ncbi:MAG: glycosyltransferase [Syntrophorhabdales bacterium]